MRNKLLLPGILALLLQAMNCQAQVARNEKSVPARAGGVSVTGGLKTGRAAHTATVLKNGRVLIAGGFTGAENSLASAEIFDPAAKAFSAAGRMSAPRAGHSATLLPDGRVLLAGGYNGSYLDSAEIYDPETGNFAPAGKMTVPRSGHVAVLLAGGKVLLAGGVGTGWTFLADAELFDPAANTFTATGKMTAARESHTATLLRDGRVLIAGGHRGRRREMTIHASAEIYDPAAGAFAATGNLTVRRHKHDAALLGDGRVLIVGGADERDSRGAYTTVEIYDPNTKIFARIGDMNLPRYKLQGTTVLLANGKILIAGGAERAEIYDPAANTFQLATGNFETRRLFATATHLPDGSVLIVGGYDESITVSSRAWIYQT